MPTYYGLRVDGGDFVTDNLTRPLDDLEEAKRLARELSLQPGNEDGVSEVVSRSGEDGGQAYWESTAAAFVNGEEIRRDDERYPS